MKTINTRTISWKWRETTSDASHASGSRNHSLVGLQLKAFGQLSTEQWKERVIACESLDVHAAPRDETTTHLCDFAVITRRLAASRSTENLDMK